MSNNVLLQGQWRKYIAHWLIGPVRCGSNVWNMIYKLIIHNCSFGTHCEIALKWMLQKTINKKSKLSQVCRARVIIWDNVDPDLCRHKASLGINVSRHTWFDVFVTMIYHHSKVWWIYYYSQIYKKKWLNSVASWSQKRSIHVAHQYLEMYRIHWLVTQLFNINHLML